MRLPQILHSSDGPLTRELLQQPGGFGLGKVPAKFQPDSTTTSVCGFCSTGCGLKIHLKDHEAVNLTPETSYPVNLGMACPKGWEALAALDSPERATVPLLRNESSQKLEETSWDNALDQFVDRFKAIQSEHGNHSVAFLGTGQLPTEELAFLGALGKFGMSLLHGDGNTRQCMATAVVAYKQSFGFDAPPYTYADFEASDVIVLVGSNLCIAHPIMWERIMRNPHSPEIVVVDPRATETAMNATQHLAIQPKSDLTLFYGIARLLIENNWVDQQFIDASTTEFEEFADFVQAFTLQQVVTETGLSEEQILRLAETIHKGQRVSFWWTMGVNQSHQGVRTAQAMINLALMTGNIGRPGTGANSITGQCNAMGSRLFSNTTNLLGGHDFTRAEDRQKIAGLLQIPAERIPDQNSLPYHRILEQIDAGQIKGLWVICTNPAHSWINQSAFRETLSKLDFLVVQDMYDTTETAQLADLVLPAAGWGEKEGTFINSERRIGVIKKVRRSPGQALSDFNIFRLVADRWGCGDLFTEWTNPEAVFQILKRCSAGQPCDITGIKDYQALDTANGIQWPFAAGETPSVDSADNERRLFEDGRFYHPDDRAKFLFEDPVAMKSSNRFPLTLLTGRGTASQWHTQTRTRQSSVLRKLYPDGNFVEVNPLDASATGLSSGETAIIRSEFGEIEAVAVVTKSVQAGHVFVPMHDPKSNQLVAPDFDSYSSQPAYKSGAVSLHRKK